MPSLSGQRPVPTEDDDALYRRLVQSAVTNGLLAQWGTWTSNALRQPPVWGLDWPDTIEIYRRDIATAAFPGTRPELERALKNFSYAMGLAIMAFLKYHPKAEGDWLVGEAFYRRGYGKSDEHEVMERYDAWLRDCAFSVAEATNAANWLAETVRQALDKQFLNQSWLHFENGSSRYVSRYSPEEKRARPAHLQNLFAQAQYQKKSEDAEMWGDAPPKPPRELVEPEPALEPEPADPQRHNTMSTKKTRSPSSNKPTRPPEDGTPSPAQAKPSAAPKPLFPIARLSATITLLASTAAGVLGYFHDKRLAILAVGGMIFAILLLAVATRATTALSKTGKHSRVWDILAQALAIFVVLYFIALACFLFPAIAKWLTGAFTSNTTAPKQTTALTTEMPPGAQPNQDPTPPKSYPGIVVTLKDDVVCEIELSLVDQLLPTNAPYVAATFGSQKKARETLQPRIKSAVAKTFEPITLQEARSRRAELEKQLFNLLTPDFQGAGLSLISVSLTDYVVLQQSKDSELQSSRPASNFPTHWDSSSASPSHTSTDANRDWVSPILDEVKRVAEKEPISRRKN